MTLFDVNVLIYAHRAELPQHRAALKLVTATVEGNEAFGVADLVLSSLLRIATHHRAFNPHSTINEALAFCEAVRGAPAAVLLEPGPRHWGILTELCRQPGIKGPLVTDAWIAALAIEHRCELLTEDGDFKRFAPRLKLRGI